MAHSSQLNQLQIQAKPIILLFTLLFSFIIISFHSIPTNHSHTNSSFQIPSFTQSILLSVISNSNLSTFFFIAFVSLLYLDVLRQELLVQLRSHIKRPACFSSSRRRRGGGLVSYWALRRGGLVSYWALRSERSELQVHFPSTSSSLRILLSSKTAYLNGRFPIYGCSLTLSGNSSSIVDQNRASEAGSIDLIARFVGKELLDHKFVNPNTVSRIIEQRGRG